MLIARIINMPPAPFGMFQAPRQTAVQLHAHYRSCITEPLAELTRCRNFLLTGADLNVKMTGSAAFSAALPIDCTARVAIMQCDQYPVILRLAHRSRRVGSSLPSVRPPIWLAPAPPSPNKEYRPVACRSWTKSIVLSWGRRAIPAAVGRTSRPALWQRLPG